MSLTFLLHSPGSSGLSLLGADWFLSVLLLDGQRDHGDLRKFLSPPGSILLNEHFSNPGGRRRERNLKCSREKRFFNFPPRSRDQTEAAKQKSAISKLKMYTYQA